MKKIILILSLIIPIITFAQYAPPAGQSGSTAIYKDSSIFAGWATQCHIIRGYENIADTSLGKASVGDSTMALGKAMTNGVVSLGDGGIAILHFAHPIRNGASYDFAVFENGFGDYYLELAFVEVSSDNAHFFRFPSVSLTDTTTQIASFDSLDATKLYDLAGKYCSGYGTPFDLSELPNSPYLDKDSIVTVKIIDVVGCMQDQYATRDSQGNKVNDPWPTAFPSSGFDLDAVGVIHQIGTTSIQNIQANSAINIYPNPIQNGENIHISGLKKGSKIEIYNLLGKQVFEKENSNKNNIQIDMNNFKSGIYFIKILNENKVSGYKIIKSNQ